MKWEHDELHLLNHIKQTYNNKHKINFLIFLLFNICLLIVKFYVYNVKYMS